MWRPCCKTSWDEKNPWLRLGRVSCAGVQVGRIPCKPNNNNQDQCFLLFSRVVCFWAWFSQEGFCCRCNLACSLWWLDAKQVTGCGHARCELSCSVVRCLATVHSSLQPLREWRRNAADDASQEVWRVCFFSFHFLLSTFWRQRFNLWFGFGWKHRWYF